MCCDFAQTARPRVGSMSASGSSRSMALQRLVMSNACAATQSVLVTLIYLAVQVRAIRTETVVNSVSQSIQDHAQLNTLDIQFASLLIKASNGIELTEEERFILSRVYRAYASFYFHQYIRIKELLPERVWSTSIRPFCDLLESNSAFMKLFEETAYEGDPDENIVEFLSLVNAELKSRRDA